MGIFQVNGQIQTRGNGLGIINDASFATKLTLSEEQLWARGHYFIINDTEVGSYGLYGRGTTPYYYWVGQNMYAPWMKIEPNGTVTATKFVGSLQGNADTASKLATARTISLTGSVTGSGSFDGSGNLSISTTTNHTHSYLPLSGGQMSGPIYMGSTSTKDGPSIVFFSNKRNYIWMGYANDNGSWYIWDSHNSTGIIHSDVNGNNTFFGNAASASKLAISRTISLTGSVTGSGSFDGSGNLSISTTTNHNHDSVYVNVTGDTMSGTLTSYASSGFIQVMNDTSNWRNVVSWRNTTQESGTYLSGLGRHNTGGNGSYPGCITILPYATDSSPWGRGVGLSVSKDNVIFEGHTICDNAGKVYGAVWNDYAEFRTQKEEIEPGYCVASNNNGKVYKTNQHLQACDGIVSDTYGFSIGETDNCKTPLAVSGRVLAYYEGNKYDYNAGDTVGASANGKIIKMTREEITKYPDRIVGIVSEIPEYDTWGTGNISTAERIWIKVK